MVCIGLLAAGLGSRLGESYALNKAHRALLNGRVVKHNTWAEGSSLDSAGMKRKQKEDIATGVKRNEGPGRRGGEGREGRRGGKGGCGR